MPSRNVGMFVLIIPLITTPIERTELVTLTVNPVCWNKVLKMIPSDSPQFVIQRTLAAIVKNSCGVRGRPAAKSAKRAKRMLEMTSKGNSLVVYARKNEVVL
jgi:hypothetical protein